MFYPRDNRIAVRIAVFVLAVFFAFVGENSFAQTLVVNTIQPERRDIEREISLPGTLKAFEEATLFAKVSGYLDEVKVDIGDSVKRGDTLAVLDIPEMKAQMLQAESKIIEAQANVTKAKAEAEAAKANAVALKEKENSVVAMIDKYDVETRLKKTILDRFKGLKEDGAITDQEYDEALGGFDAATATMSGAKSQIASAKADTLSAQSHVEVAKSGIAVAQASLASAKAEWDRYKALSAYAVISAPFDGIITGRYVHPGALINEGMSSQANPLLRIVREEKLRLQFYIPENDVPYIDKGSPLTFATDSSKHQLREAEVTRLSGELLPDTRSMLAEVILDNTEHEMDPGMFVRLSVQMEVTKNALTLPAKALFVKDKRTHVWVEEGGKVTLVPIEVGFDDGITLEVTQGLDENTKVVSTGQNLLKEGMQVRVSE